MPTKQPTQRTRTQYCVVSKREGNNVKRKTFFLLKLVMDRVGILTSPEPWRFYGPESDREREATEYACCAGTRYDECNCGGLTLAEETAEKRKTLPPIEWVRVEQRTITTTPWVERQDVIVGGAEGDGSGNDSKPLRSECV